MTTKRTYALQNLGCAACAAKMEKKIGALDGVQTCTVNFLTSKLIIEGEEAQLPQIAQEANRIVRRIEPKASVKL